MFKPAFSTVACSDWPLRDVAAKAVGLGFEAVELRTFGDGSRFFACDPALSSEAKVRAMFREAGVEVASLGTGLRFDEVVFPPVVGYLSPDHERNAREGKRAVDLAVGIECPVVRVFGFEYHSREKTAAAMKRIGERLRMVADHADKSGVKVAVENGGSFASATALRGLVDHVAHPCLGAAYSWVVGAAAGDEAKSAIETLGDSLVLARIKDLDATGKPVSLGQGRSRVESFVRALAEMDFNGPLVYEWDRAWFPQIAGPDVILAQASRTIYGWMGAAGQGSVKSAARVGVGR